MPEDVEKIVAIYSKQQESPEGGAISNHSELMPPPVREVFAEGSPIDLVMEELGGSNKEPAPPAEDIAVELRVDKGLFALYSQLFFADQQEPEAIPQEDKAPAAEPPDEAPAPIAANDESPMEEDYEMYENVSGDTSISPSQVNADASNDIQFPENEDYEIAHAVSRPTWVK